MLKVDESVRVENIGEKQNSFLNWLQDKLEDEMKTESYKHYINKVDAVRYFYLYEYGGLYMDLDIIFKKDITNLLTENKCYLFSQNAINDYFSNKNYKKYIDPMLIIG